ncbi:DNA-binding protein [Bradyrhizobium sp. NBAIM20]|uniref:DNA-binding protein n=1 Tax=unclassified Bradyrhizobium TaxID=2631580 RepID=UPI001CD2FF4C|nr:MULTISPECIES: DNA-binding protein [unclassified Bradyrhizobium]MCA1414468.1 DNA-binding protein [Bradyrhizobium sp. NBAIM20]MCA1459870.1 DNA-binding protein [Bradyrhizobium sp. NBAIM18]
MESAAQNSFGKRSFRIDEFAARNSISRSQAYVEVKEGRLRARKVGSTTLITIEDESAWLASLPQAKPNHGNQAA